MSKQLKIFILTIAGVAIGASFVISVLLFNPLRRPDAGVRAWLLNRMPLGSSSQEVRAYAEKQGWFNVNRQGSDGHTSGTYIRGELGRYRSIRFYTYVTVFWEFDSSNRLAEIRIWKTTDGY